MKYRKLRDICRAVLFSTKKGPEIQSGLQKREDARQLSCLAFIYEKVSFKGMSILFYGFIICRENEEIMFIK